MRWLFLLLLVLNGCYLIWNLQDVPVRAKDITSTAQGAKGDHAIQLLSEAGNLPASAGNGCVFLGGFTDISSLRPVAQRLLKAGVPLQAYQMPGAAGEVEHWFRLPATPAMANPSVEELSTDIKGLKHKIIQCEGIATPEQFE
jgi:hypothetical protein